MRWKIVFCLLIVFTIVYLPVRSDSRRQIPETSEKSQKAIKPKVNKGVINLSDWNFQNNGTIQLFGDWEFYWNKLLSPEDFKVDQTDNLTGFVNVPGSWNYYKNKDGPFSGHGYATYRLKIKLKKNKTYALRILPISTAYRVWIDEKVYSVGKVGKSLNEMIPDFAVKTIQFHPDNPETRIVLQVSNFFHRSGGPWRSIEIGLSQQIINQRIISAGFDLFLIGAILIMGLYHFGLYILRKKDITTLYFGLLCVVAVIRTLMTSEHIFYFLFPEFNWLIAYKFEYLSFYISIPLAVLFINNLFPDESVKATSQICISVSIVFSLIVLFTQPQIFTHTVISYEYIAVISMLYIIFVIVRAALRKRSGAILVAIGSIVAIATLVNDIFYANEVISSFYMAPTGILFFILFHSLNLSMKTSSAFNNMESIEKKYRSMFENSLDGILQVSFIDETFIANPALAQMLGYSSPERFPRFVKKTWAKVFADAGVCDQYLNKLRIEKQVAEFEAEFLCKNGSSIWVSINSKAETDKNNNISKIDSIVHNITHRKEKEILEAKMLQVQKMEAMGYLAEGIAHDFNNIISAISSNVHILLMDKSSLGKKETIKFKNIIDACDRATGLISQILTFSRKNKKENFKLIRLDSIIKEVTRFIRNTIPENIKIEQNISPKSFRIISDSTQIYQVIMNLYYNAIDAMGNNGGALKVSLLPVEKEDMKTSTGFLKKGDYIELSITDTGEGISSDIIKKIFDPYFTTKAQGKGTGLGLATVHGIVKSHEGEIQVDSIKGKGTSFKIYFPIPDKDEQKIEYGEGQIEIAGHGKLLFVDDEEVIADSYGELLDTLGFDVDTYHIPKEAVKRVEKNLYDLIITDFQMPQMDGIEFARAIRRKDKNVKIILCSGDPSAISSEEIDDLDLHSIIQKPLEFGELTRQVEQAINRR